MPDQLHQGRSFRPGFVFKDGKGYLFEGGGLDVMRPWPQPAAWRLTPKARGFRHTVPNLDLREVRRWAARGFVERRVTAYVALQGELTRGDVDAAAHAKEVERIRAGFTARQRSARAFLDEIPPHVRRIVCRFRHRHWPVLSMLGRAPRSLDLITSNPALGWMLASNPMFHRPNVERPMRACRTWCSRPRPEIAAWLGFPATRSAVRLLGKIEPQALTTDGLRALRARMLEGAPIVRSLAHVPRITRDMLDVVGPLQFAPIVTPALLGFIATADRFEASRTVRTLFEVARMGAALEADLRPVRTTAELRNLHDELVERTEAARHGRVEILDFPDPPLAPEDGIEPIADHRALIDEGAAQHHCVASYAKHVAERRLYVYRVTGPERATVSIKPRADGTWRISELRASHNRSVTRRTRRRIERWLSPEPPPYVDRITPVFPQFGDGAPTPEQAAGLDRD